MKLRCEREAKAKEFAEVKDLSSRLMEVMGIDHTRTATKITHQNTQPSKSSSSGQIEHRIQEVNSAVDPRHTFVASAASRLGPTARRTKTLRSSKSSVAHPKPSTPRWEGDGGLTNNKSRSPLKEMGINHSPSKKVAVIPFPSLLHTCGELQDLDNDEPGKENEDNSFDKGEYKDSFSESDIFTSTDSRQYSENNERFMTGHFDDMTVDF